MEVPFKVSDVSFVVLGFPSTNNTVGNSHVKIEDGVLTCNSKDTDCRSFVAKGRYERAKKICVHLHAISSVREAIGEKHFLPPALVLLMNVIHVPVRQRSDIKLWNFTRAGRSRTISSRQQF